MAAWPSLTVEEIAKAVRVPTAKLDQECSAEHVKEISCFLESRQTLAPHLNLKETDIEEIDKDKRTEQEKRLKTLQKWKERFIFRATYKVLMEALLKTGRADHARDVCRLLSTIPTEDTETPLQKRILELESQLKSKSDELSRIRKRQKLDDSTTEETMEPCNIGGAEAASSMTLEEEETDVVKEKEQGHIFSGKTEGESSDSCETQPSLSATDGLATDRIIEEETTNDPGIEFATAARRFIIKNGKSYQFELQGYGLRVLVPDRALPPDVQQCTLDVRVSLSGKCSTGDDYEPTSATYWLSSSEKFFQPLILEVQHSAVMDDPSSTLCFVVARSNELPHKFRKVEGGVFSPTSRYGSFHTKELSGWGIVVPRGGRQYYRGQLWYSQISDTKWKIYITITVDLDAVACAAALLLGNPVKGHATTIDFEGNELQIDVPSEGITAQEWDITPRYKRMILKHEVTSFTSVRLLPVCELDVEWKQNDKVPGPLSHSFSLVGAKQPNDKLLLELPMERSQWVGTYDVECLTLGLFSGTDMKEVHRLQDQIEQMKEVHRLQDQQERMHGNIAHLKETEQILRKRLQDARRKEASFTLLSDERPTLLQFQVLKGVKGEIRIMDTVAPHWRDFGIALGFDSSDLDALEEANFRVPIRCTERVFGLWSKRGRNFTWGGLVTALEDSGFKQLACDLKEALYHLKEAH